MSLAPYDERKSRSGDASNRRSILRTFIGATVTAVCGFAVHFRRHRPILQRHDMAGSVLCWSDDAGRSDGGLNCRTPTRRAGHEAGRTFPASPPERRKVVAQVVQANGLQSGMAGHKRPGSLQVRRGPYLGRARDVASGSPAPFL